MKTSGDWANNNSCSSSENHQGQNQKPPTMLKSNSYVEYQSTSYPISQQNGHNVGYIPN
jgi:hypothetical protein